MKIVHRWSNATVVEINDALQVLFSYDKAVAAFVPGRGFLRTNRFWSKTTNKHINKWLKEQFGPNVKVVEVEQSEIEALANDPKKQAEVLNG